MATWAKGIDFKNSNNTSRIGGIGIYGTDSTINKLYIGLGVEPWNNAGLQLTNSAINFKGNKIYHAGDKPTASEIGAAASSHTHNYMPHTKYTTTQDANNIKTTGVYSFNATCTNAATSNHGTLIAEFNVGTPYQLWMPDNANIIYKRNYTTSSNTWGSWNNTLANNISGNASTATTLQTARTLTIGNTGKSFNGSGNISWSLSEIGAAAASHSHNSLTTKGTNTINSTANDTTANWGAHGHSVHWYTQSGCLNGQPSQYGYILNLGSGTEVHQLWMTQASGNLAHRGGNGSGWNGSWKTILDSSNFTSYAASANHSHSNYAASSHTHNMISMKSGHVSDWTSSSAMNGKTYMGGWHGNLTSGTVGYISLGANGSSTLDLFIDGEVYVKENQKVYHPGNKPTASDIGAAEASHTHNYAAASHTHGLLHDTMIVEIPSTTTDNGWSMLNSSYNGFLLKSIRTNAKAPSWILGDYSAGIVFGGADTKGVLSMGYSSPTIKFAGGNGTKPVWNMALTGSSGKTYNMESLSANTATKLATARTINGTSFNGSANITTANWGTARTITIGNTGKSVNGSGNVSWSLAEIGAAAASHTHSNYVSTSGGQQINGDLNFTKKLRLYENSAISFMLDAGQTYLESGTLYSDKNGGVTFLTGRGIETSLNNNAYFEGINGFTKSFEILTSTSPSITLTPLTNPTDNTGGRIIFKSPDNQNVQLRHEWYDGSLMPFGLVLEKASGNAQAFNACLKVQGAVICGVNDAFIDNTNKPDARIVRGSTDNAGGLKIQMGGTNTTASFEVVNPNWSAAWFSCGNTGIRSNSYSNFSDEKLKTNIEEVNYSVSDKINKIKIYNYNYLSDYNRVIPSIIKRDIKCKTTAITRLTKTDNYKISLSSKTNELYEDVPEKRWGVIAQEVEELFPELITETEELIDGEKKLVKSVDVYGLTVLTLEFAKELKAEIQSMKEKLGLE